MRGISIMAFLLAVALLIGAGCGGGSGTSSRPDGFYETSHPVFTPDGKGIVVAAVWHSRSTLFHMDLEGNNITRFLASSRPVTSPIFSPDGKSMAVVLPRPSRTAAQLP